MQTLGQKLGSSALRYRHPLHRGQLNRRTGTAAGHSAAAEGQSGESSPWARDYVMARLEAVLFLTREPVNSRKLAQLARLTDGTEARALVRRLNRLYEQASTPFRVEEVAGGFQMLTRPKFAGWLRRLFHSPAEMRLSAPALETLAVVAYRQPVLRAEIESIRGVQCDDILRQLMDRDLIRMVGRSPELGRPLLYGTTKRFQQVFGLRSLDELPRADSLRRAAKPSVQPALSTEIGTENAPTRPPESPTS